MRFRDGIENYQKTIPPCPIKETKEYIKELVDIIYELNKRLNNNQLSEFEARTIASIFKSWFTLKEVKIEDAERKTEGKQE